jgi:hypothetical protein
MTAKIIGLFAVLLCAPALATTMAASPEPTGQDSPAVTGTLEELDLSKMSGKIKTDLEQTVGLRYRIRTCLRNCRLENGSPSVWMIRGKLSKSWKRPFRSCQSLRSKAINHDLF